MTLHRAEECLASFFSVSVSPVFFFSYQILPLLFHHLPYRRKAAEQLTFLSYLKNIELFSESQLFANYHSHRKIKELLFTPCPATRCAMHRIYADRINSRDMSRVFCDLRSQKTPRGILPVNNNIKEQKKIRGDNFLLELNNYM